MSPALERIRQRWAVASVWRLPALMGIAATTIVWCVWYFTKIPCLPDNAVKGLCNPGWLARFINAEILVLAGGAGIAVATLKGGYDYYMLKNMINQEREARLKTEQELRDLIFELRDELREAHSKAEEYRQRLEEERRQTEEERRQAEEERRQRLDEERRQTEEVRRQAEAEERRLAAADRDRSIAIQQAMLEAIVQLAQGRNGNGSRASD